MTTKKRTKTKTKTGTTKTTKTKTKTGTPTTKPLPLSLFPIPTISTMRLPWKRPKPTEKITAFISAVPVHRTSSIQTAE